MCLNKHNIVMGGYNMTIKEFFGFSTQQYETNYYISFKKKRPELYDHPNLIKFGKWYKNGVQGYRILSTLSRKKFIKAIMKELKINKDDFYLFSVFDNRACI